MAVLEGSISAGQLSAYTADKPLILSKNLLENGLNVCGEISPVSTSNPETMSGCWRSSTAYTDAPVKTATVLGTYRNTDPWQSPLNALDRSIGTFTAPFYTPHGDGESGIPRKKHCLIFRLEAVTASVPIDSVVIGAHNFAELNEGNADKPLLVSVFASDTHTFISYYTVAQWNITSNYPTTKRLVSVHLGSTDTPSTIYNVNYIQVVISQSSLDVAAPQIGEVFVGPRRQLSRTPDHASWELDQTENVIGVFTPKTGDKRFYRVSSGRELMRPKWAPSGDPDLGTTDLYSLDDLATLDAFWADISYGAKPFFFMPNPYSVATSGNAYFMYSERLEFPAQILGGLTEREVEFELRELSPYLSSEV